MKKRLGKSIFALLCCLCLACSCMPALATSFNGSYSYYNTDYAVVTGTSYLNLRQGPGTDSAWLGRANENDWVRVQGEVGNWYYVTIVESNLSGYMSKNFLTLAAAAPSVPSVPSAGNGTMGVVTNPKPTQFLNLRQYPSYDAPVLGIFYNGAVCQILAAFDGWYQVIINGQTGYFRQEFVTVSNNSSSSSGSQTATIHTLNGGKLNLRNAPTYKGSSIIAQIPNGRQVTVLLKGNYFWKVQVDGKTGYMDCSFLTEKIGSGTSSPTPNLPVTKPVTNGYAIVNNPKPTQFLNLREQASTSSKVIAQYKNGIRFEIIEPGETWCKVYGSATGNIGYMMTKYLTLYGVSSSPTKVVQNGNTYVNLRSAPSKQTGNVYNKLYSGSVVVVLTPGEEWTQVRYGNTVGYMMTVFLK
ncbi:MAG: SH3 domain-containing protein [Clostridia bacterium]|nr:SH3 domain-containing protein [Clostridia bacterium]